MSLVFEMVAVASPASDDEYLGVRHLVTLQEPETLEEVTMMIWTRNDSFCEVLREIKRTVMILFLDQGIDYRRYKLYEASPLGDSF